MVFQPPHGDDCPVCRERYTRPLTPDERRLLSTLAAPLMLLFVGVLGAVVQCARSWGN